MRRMNLFVMLCLCVFLLSIGCNDSNRSPKQTKPSSDEIPETQPEREVPLQVVLNKKDFPVRSVLSQHFGGKMNRIILSSELMTCSSFREKGYWALGARIFLYIAPTLSSVKTNPWHITAVNWLVPSEGGVSSLGHQDKVVPTFSSDDTLTHIDFGSLFVEGLPGVDSIELKGGIKVENCGIADGYNEATVASQVSIVLGDEKIAINGALLIKEFGQDVLVLTSLNIGCAQYKTIVHDRSDVLMRFVFEPKTKTLSSVRLSGHRFFSGTNHFFHDVSSFTVNLPEDALLKTTKHAVVELAGKTDIASLPMQLSGRVKAERCSR